MQVFCIANTVLNNNLIIIAYKIEMAKFDPLFIINVWLTKVKLTKVKLLGGTNMHDFFSNFHFRGSYRHIKNLNFRFYFEKIFMGSGKYYK